MVKKSINFIAGIAICSVFVSCFTLRAPLTRQLEQPVNKEANTNGLSINCFNNPKMNDALNSTNLYCINQNWDKAITALADISKSVNGDDRAFCVNYLSKMAYEPLPIKKIHDSLADNNDNESKATVARIESAITNSCTLNWKSDEVKLTWQKPKFFSLYERLGFSSKFHPIVQVKINNRIYRMIVDTGADSCVIFSDILNKTQAEEIKGSETTITDSNHSSSSTRLALIHTMQLEGLEISNVQAYIAKRPFGESNFDGLIGWPIISQMKIVFDSINAVITLTPSKKEMSAKPNFLWIGEPIIVASGGDAQAAPIYFFLDTGSNKTTFSQNGLFKTNLKIGDNTKQLQGGINGYKQVNINKVDRMSFTLDNTELTFINQKNDEPMFPLFNVDGLLGCDVAQSGILTLDYPSGKYSFIPYR